MDTVRLELEADANVVNDGTRRSSGGNRNWLHEANESIANVARLVTALTQHCTEPRQPRLRVCPRLVNYATAMQPFSTAGCTASRDVQPCSHYHEHRWNASEEHYVPKSKRNRRSLTAQNSRRAPPVRVAPGEHEAAELGVIRRSHVGPRGSGGCRDWGYPQSSSAIAQLRFATFEQEEQAERLELLRGRTLRSGNTTLRRIRYTYSPQRHPTCNGRGCIDDYLLSALGAELLASVRRAFSHR
jgi:hypothetical protein